MFQCSIRPIDFRALLMSGVATAIVSTAAFAEPPHHGAETYNPELYNRPLDQQRFGRMFPIGAAIDTDRDGQAESHLAPHPSPVYDLVRLGRFREEGGLGPMVENQPNNPEGDSGIEAGITFLAQFIDHDLTLDTSSTLNGGRFEPENIVSVRTPSFDLDCVYGRGPDADPWLYAPVANESGADIPASFRPFLTVGTPYAGNRHDLARNANGTALIGDPRNDENFVISQLQGAFIAFHNQMVQAILDQNAGELALYEENGTDPRRLKRSKAAGRSRIYATAFDQARDNVLHYYHRLVVEYFLPKVIGIARTLDIAQTGRRYYLAGADGAKTAPVAFMPIEFSAAAYRFGHSQVRQAYRIRDGEPRLQLFKPGEVVGFTPISDARALDWAKFTPIEGRDETTPEFARRIDPRLPKGLFQLDLVDVVGAGDLGSLASRNLNRGRVFRLPAGEDLHDIIVGGDPSVPRPEQDDVVAEHIVLNKTPLWYYVLMEAEQWPVSFLDEEGVATPTFPLETNISPTAMQQWPQEVRASVEAAGLRAERAFAPATAAGSGTGSEPCAEVDGRTVCGQILGPVGGTIVGEVLIGLLDRFREEHPGKGLDHSPNVLLELTTIESFGPRMTLGAMIRFIGWDQPPAP